MIYKLYLIEIIGNFSILFGILAAMLLISLVYLVIRYIDSADDYHYTINEKQRIRIDIFRSKFKKRFYILLSCFIISLSIAVLTPSKTFMYSATGIHETLNFIKGNEEVRKISKKTIQIIDKKLDSLIKDEE